MSYRYYIKFTWNCDLFLIQWKYFSFKLHVIIFSNSHWVASVVISCFHSCPTLYDSMNCSPPGSSVHGILQARILEWVAICFSRGSSKSRDRNSDFFFLRIQWKYVSFKVHVIIFSSSHELFRHKYLLNHLDMHTSYQTYILRIKVSLLASGTMKNC